MRIFLLICLLGFSVASAQLIDRWHTYDEIQQQLEDWDSEFGSNPEPSPGYPGSGIIYHYEEIGRSTQDNIPFWGVRLSYNADVKEDEPRILFLGQCHAEEIYGVETTMELINMFLHPEQHVGTMYYQYMRALLQSAEVWVVPTYNPEGLRVVHGYNDDGDWIQDVAYRKDKRDVNQNGVFDYVQGSGNDSDGVDLNRNYDFNWIFGDGLWEPDPGGGNPSYFAHYDYYRGSAPFSETETQAIRDFAEAQHFLLSIAFHSSRSGNVSEKVIYSWDWEETGKVSPDFDMISELGIEIAGFIPKESGTGYYTPVTSKSRRGNAHDWLYSQTGCIQYLIEQGTENLQPDDEELIDDTVARGMRGAFHLMNRAIGMELYELGADQYQVTGLVTDADTGAPVHARVTIPELNGPMLKPRMTDEFGRYRRLLSPGIYTLDISASGYESQSFPFSPSSSAITVINANLNPVSAHQLSFVIDDHWPGQRMLILEDEIDADTLYCSNTGLTVELPETHYEIRIQGDDGQHAYFPRFYSLDLIEDTEIDATQRFAGIVFQDDFDTSQDWQILSGDWTTEMGYLFSQSEDIYSNQLQVYTTAQSFEVPAADHYALLLDMAYEVEWEQDTAFVALSSNESVFTLNWSDQKWYPHEEYHAVDIPSGTNLDLTIGLDPDSTLGYRGLKIDSIALLYEPEGTCPMGDMTYDGHQTIQDVLYLVDLIMSETGLTSYTLCTADFNQDDAADILDLIALVELILA